MTKLEQIEKSVTELDKQEFQAFSAWFEALKAERWDRRMEGTPRAASSIVSRRRPWQIFAPKKQGRSETPCNSLLLSGL
ncbi:hypothetical protein [Rhizobium redzepovicii]|mgnify:CR=1 FL=1|uniref:hypothetical protein n=1 Tax=Rhizobium TaxID=379 RepID=UPI001793FE4E|nr:MULTISPECIES: hypothetical protein [Rhizobium]MDF0659104.1 hypothetical protein [Rhizobium sp. BC49]ULJ79036.1 hypothetical protein MF410_02705 [Rhizobium sp. C104]